MAMIPGIIYGFSLKKKEGGEKKIYNTLGPLATSPPSLFPLSTKEFNFK